MKTQIRFYADGFEIGTLHDLDQSLVDALTLMTKDAQRLGVRIKTYGPELDDGREPRWDSALSPY